MKRRSRSAVSLLVAMICISGCTSSRSGHGSAAPKATFPSTPSLSTHAALPRSVRPKTALGDPATVDICSALPQSLFQPQGLKTDVEPFQEPASCSITLHAGSLLYSLSVYVDLNDDTNPNAIIPGTTRRTVDGFPALRFDAQSGSGVCDQILGDGETDFQVQVEARGGLSRQLGCAITDAAVQALADRLHHHTFAQYVLADPSLVTLDYCALVAPHLVELPPIGLYPRVNNELDVGCDLASTPVNGASVHARVTLTYSTAKQPPNSTPAVVDGHHVYLVRFAKYHGFPCSYSSVGPASRTGLHEQIGVTTIGVNRGVPVPTACAINKALLLDVLTGAALS